MRNLERERLNASIDIFDTMAVVTGYGPGNKKTRKHVSFEQLATAFQPLIGKKLRKIEPGVLAVGKNDDGNERVLVLRAARATTINVRIVKMKQYKLMMPNLLAELGRDKNGWISVGRVLAFAGKANSLTDKTKLHLPPLPNISDSDGRVCMGNVKTDIHKRLSAIDFFETVFIESNFADHYLERPLVDGSGYRNILDAIKKNKGKVPFKILKKVCTYEQIFN